MEPRDEEKVCPPPSPGYSDSHVPVWHESSRTGRGNNFKQDLFLPLSNSQVPDNQAEMYQVMCPTPISTTALGTHHNADIMCINPLQIENQCL